MEEKTLLPIDKTIGHLVANYTAPKWHIVEEAHWVLPEAYQERSSPIWERRCSCSHVYTSFPATLRVSIKSLSAYFLRVWSVQYHLLFLISTCIAIWLHIWKSNLLDMAVGHQIFKIFLRQLLTTIWSFFSSALASAMSHISIKAPIRFSNLWGSRYLAFWIF